MNSINERLRELYMSKIDGIKTIYESSKDLDGPLLMYCWEEKYLKARKKILFVGKETYGWLGCKSNNIDNTIKRYKDFDMSKQIRKFHNSPFWRSIFDINNKLYEDFKNKNCFLWTNVTKYCLKKNDRRINLSLSDEDFNYELLNLNLLKEEIEIIKPDVIIFFTGPYFDNRIRKLFDENLTINSISDINVSKKDLAKLEGINLPENTYRTYHPKYLYITKKRDYLDKIINKILK